MNVDAVLIAGPTASGKSEAALALAERINGALVNADSMQVYREARILTARPDDHALSRVPHFLYGHVSVNDVYSVARYQADAIRAFHEARENGRLPVFVGGAGLYFSALTDGLAEMPEVSSTVRKSVRARREAIGTDAFFAALARCDPASAAQLHASDTQRVLRAAEVLEATGRPLSEWQQERGVAPLAELRLARFVLSPPRIELHRRIEARFDRMIEAGALEEARQLGGIDPALPSAKLLGLRELRSVIDGSSTLDAARALAKTVTRQYAKRQVTWFRRRMANWVWIAETAPSAILGQMLEQR